MKVAQTQNKRIVAGAWRSADIAFEAPSLPLIPASAVREELTDHVKGRRLDLRRCARVFAYVRAPPHVASSR